MDKETNFFEHDGVRVTNTRLIVDGQTFAMNNITSVKALETKPSRLLPALMILGGLIGLLSAGSIWMLFPVAVGVFVWTRQKLTFHVMLHTAGGETSAVRSHQREYVQSVVTALNNAIVHRG